MLSHVSVIIVRYIDLLMLICKCHWIAVNIMVGVQTQTKWPSLTCQLLAILLLNFQMGSLLWLTFWMVCICRPTYLPTFWVAWIGQPYYLPTFWTTGHPVTETKVSPIWISTGFLVCWPTFIKLPAGFCVSKQDYLPTFWMAWIGQPNYLPTFWMAWIGQPDYLPTFWNTGHPVAETKVNPIWISIGFLVCWQTFIKLPAGFCVSKPGYMPAFWIVWIGQPHYMPTFWMAWIGH